MKDSVFNYLEYRIYIKGASKALGINYKLLAASARIHTSYFSRVMQGAADFSKEQLYLISRDLKLDPEETEFLLLLGEYASSSLEVHQKFVLKKIKRIQKEKQKLINKFSGATKELSTQDIAIYYQESITAQIHILLTIKKYRLNSVLICKKLFISEVKLNQEILKLSNLKIIKLENNNIEILKYSVHLDESHHASQQNHVNWRLETINHLLKREGKPSDYHLSAVFSCDEASKSKIKNNFKKFIVDIQKIVQDSPDTDDAYFIGLDLY